MNKRTLLWLLFTVTGAVAYALVYWEAFFPLGRIIAGWYAIFVIIIVLGAGVVTLSVHWGPLRNSGWFADFFSLW
ncbi:MAG: hypothetical protein JWL63_3058 [Rhodocyclales bacterium]|nr:hypothetical protein [Rhodocyclales bacterium]